MDYKSYGKIDLMEIIWKSYGKMMYNNNVKHTVMLHFTSGVHVMLTL